MSHLSLRIIRDEHAALSAMLRSLSMMVQRGPVKDSERQNYFEVMRAMLFYVDEFPERLHHTKESELLFPMVAQRSPHISAIIDQLEHEHARGEHAVRALAHLLLAWELLGDTRRAAFEAAVNRYISFYLEHMRLEEQEVIPEALKVLSPEDWQALDEAFSTNADPLTGKYPTHPDYAGLFSKITLHAPAPIGLGAA